MTTPSYPIAPLPGYSVLQRPLISLAVQTMASGKELLADFWLGQHKWEFTLTYPRLTPAEMEILLGFFLANRSVPFFFDYRENKSVYGVVDASLGTGNGSDDTFQMVRSWGGLFTETCKYIHTAPQVKVAGVLQDPSYYTINSDGAVVFASGHIPAAGQAVTASFSYDYLVRFAVEGKGGSSQASSGLASLEFEQFSYRLSRLGQVDLITWFE